MIVPPFQPPPDRSVRALVLAARRYLGTRAVVNAAWQAELICGHLLALRRHELYLDTEGVEVVHVPEEIVIENRAGRFESINEQDEAGGELHVARSLLLSRPRYAAGEWTELRALLLAEQHEGHRLVLLE